MSELRDFLQSMSNSVASNVSAPVDGLAWLLRRAGVNVGTPVGGSDWMRSKGLTAEPQNKLAGLLGESIGGVFPMVAAAKAPQIAQGLLNAADNLAKPTTLSPQAGAVVWHGSPHKFDKFDASKIGTGEGAQAYGHGLYLAESPDVAKGYQSRLSDLPFQNGDQRNAAVRLIEAKGKDGERQAFNYLSSTHGEDAAKQMILDAKAAVEKGRGSLYKVDLPDDQIAKMLDWDKPLSQQSKEVQQALKKTRSMLPPNAMDDLGGDLNLLYNPANTGADFLGTMNSLSPNFGETALRNAGIPGVRYLDGGSRGAGGGTSNFVVFPGNEGMLKILERNGKGLLE